MGLSRRGGKKGIAFGWLEITLLVITIVLAVSDLTIVFTKYIGRPENTGAGQVAQCMRIKGTAIGSFYNNLGEEKVWVSGSKEAISYVKSVLQTRTSRPPSQDTFQYPVAEEHIVPQGKLF